MITTFYQYSDGSFHKAGEAVINKESFTFPVRISGLKPICKFVLKPNKNANTSGTIQKALQE